MLVPVVPTRSLKPSDERTIAGVHLTRNITQDTYRQWACLTVARWPDCASQMRLIVAADFAAGITKCSWRDRTKPLISHVYASVAAYVTTEQYETTHDGQGTGKHAYAHYLVIGSEEHFYRAIRTDGLVVDVLDGKGYGYTVEDAVRGIVDYEEDLLLCQ